MTDLTDADNAYENQVSGDKVGPQVIYKYVLKTTTTTTGSDDDDIEPIDIALYICFGFLGLLIVVLLIKGLLKYCLANGMKDMEVDDEIVKHAKDFDRKIQTVFN